MYDEEETKMKLEFADGSQMEIRTIHGGQQYIQNANRDVLTIEIDPAVCALAELKDNFQDTAKTCLLATIQTNDVSVNQDGSEAIEERQEVGTDYTLYLSAANEVREIRSEPGVLEPPKTEEINIIKVAQLSYMEKLLTQILGAQK